jgi:8-oxo-dGTP pyrophosphatase MutT (NUDIX family)
MNVSKKALHRPSILYQAAALPWRQTKGKGGGKIEVMLITSLGTRRWVLPKGTLQPNETARAAARREALEEAGIEGVLDMRSLGAYHYEKSLSSGAMQLCSVDVFALMVTGQRDRWREQDQRKLQWFSTAGAAAAVNEDDLKQIILGFDPVQKTAKRGLTRAAPRIGRSA